MEKAREYQRMVYLCFQGESKAFDCVYHELMWIMLREIGCQSMQYCYGFGNLVHTNSQSPRSLVISISMCLSLESLLLSNRNIVCALRVIFLVRFLQQQLQRQQRHHPHSTRSPLPACFWLKAWVEPPSLRVEAPLQGRAWTVSSSQ